MYAQNADIQIRRPHIFLLAKLLGHFFWQALEFGFLLAVALSTKRKRI